MQNHNSKFKTFSFLLVFLTFAFYLLNSQRSVLAQQISLSLSPPLVEVIVKPGKSLLIAYNLENYGDPATLTSFVLPFEPRGEKGQIRLKEQFEGPIRFSLENSQLKLNEPFFLKSREKTQILLKIRIPEGTPEGDYYYSLLVESKAAQGFDGTSGGLAKATIGSNILLTVTANGETNVKGAISEFTVLPHYQFNWFGHKIPLFDSSDLVPVRLTITNSGTNLIKPQGTISVKGPLGAKSSYTIIPQNILADSKRIMLATPSANINCDDKNQKLCQQTSTIVLSGFNLGKYKLSSTVNFGEQTPTIYGNTYFYSFPIKYTMGIAFTLVVGFIVIRKFKRDQS
ncbi:MAG TPA: hypothetical protein VK338_04620 [Candidatus Nitrosocosmicus sp.]|nr:hypothetical protein [Candidatus Nitrosocosmicus sp.]